MVGTHVSFIKVNFPSHVLLTHKAFCLYLEIIRFALLCVELQFRIKFLMNIWIGTKSHDDV